MILRRDVNRDLTHDEVDSNFIEAKNLSQKAMDSVEAIGSGEGGKGYPTLADALAADIPDNVIFQVDPGDPDEGIWRRDSSDPKGAVFLRSFDSKIEDWVSGSYNKGDQRLHNGQLWSVTVDNTDEEPGEGSDWSGEIDVSSGEDAFEMLQSIGEVVLKGEEIDLTGIVWTDNTYITSSGTVSTTTASVSSSNYIDLPFEGIDYRYNGNINLNHVHIAFYTADESFISSIDKDDVGALYNFIFSAPSGATKARFSCVNSSLDTFSVSLEQNAISLKSEITEMLLDERYGIDNTTYNVDQILESASVTWSDGTPGVATMGDYNQDFMSFDSYEVTYLGSETKIVKQPKITRDLEGNIITKPNIIIV